MFTRACPLLAPLPTPQHEHPSRHSKSSIARISARSSSPSEMHPRGYPSSSFPRSGDITPGYSSLTGSRNQYSQSSFSTSHSYLPPLEALSLDPLPSSRGSFSISRNTPSLLSRRNSFSRLPSLDQPPVSSFPSSFLPSSTSLHLPPLPTDIPPWQPRQRGLGRRKSNPVNCICGE